MIRNLYRLPLLTVAILQYLDFLSSVLAQLSGNGQELNPLYSGNIYSPLALSFKLIILPLGLIFTQFKLFPILKHMKPFKILSYTLLIFYIVVVTSNFLGAFGL